MTKTTRSLLVISILCLAVGLAFVTGIINVQNAAGLYVALPLGAIFFGLFLISKIFEKEAALYDEEQQARREVRKAPVTPRKTEKERGSSCSCEAREAAVMQH